MKHNNFLFGLSPVKKIAVIASLSALGFLGGFTNGLLGAGGGIIIIYATRMAFGYRDRAAELRRKYADVNTASEYDEKDILVNSLAVTLPMSALSASIYMLKGGLSGVSIDRYIIPAIIGGIFGAWLLDRLNTRIISVIFALIVLYSGISMIIK